MKNAIVPIVLLSASALCALAQNTTSKGTIEIEINENGQHRVVKREFDPENGQDVQDILKEMDVLQDIDIKTGEQVEINVRKSVKGGNADDVTVRIGDSSPRNHGTQRADRPLLGVYIRPYNGNPMGNGELKAAVVERIIPGSAAEKAGLMPGDIITGMNGTTIASDDELRSFIQNKQVGAEVTIVFLRNGKEQFATATLQSGGEGDMPRYRFNDIEMDQHGAEGAMLPEEFEQRMREMGQDMERQVRVHMAGKPKLGVTGSMGATATNGAEVDGILPGSAAEQMGVNTGDVITEVNGKPIANFAQLAETIQAMKAKETVKVMVLRDGKPIEMQGELSERTQDDDQNFDFNFFNNDKPGQWSEIVSETLVRIEIQDLTKDEEQLVAQGASVDPSKELDLTRIEFSPNPTDGSVTLEFELPSKEKTRVLVLNGTGAKVREEIIGQFDGHYRKTIDLADQPNGIYFVVIAQGNNQFTRKVVKQ